MQCRYFSDRERGETPQTATEITPEAWRGIAALIRARLDDGSFGASFPEQCDDGMGACGTNEKSFWEVLKAEIPALTESRMLLQQEDPPPLLALMDMIEFCWRSVGKVLPGKYHRHFKHRHIDFDVAAGRAEFRKDVNCIFKRNGLAYTLTERGEIERLLPGEIGEAIRRAQFLTGDTALNGMLDDARRKFLDPDEKVRREALEKLWDAWERLKTIDGEDKKAGIAKLLDQAADSGQPKFKKMLETEAKQLTDIGNTFHIRHSETTQERLHRVDHVDYLFHRLFSLIYLILRATGRRG